MMNRALLLLFTLSLRAFAAEDTEPIFCISKYVAPGVTTPSDVTEYPCTRLTFLKEIKKDRVGACMFNHGAWQRGTLQYSKKKDSYKFAADFPCELGVRVLPDKDAAGDTRASPKIFSDFYMKKNPSYISKAGNVFTSHVTPEMIVNKYHTDDPKIRPVLCTPKKMAENVACSPMPNDLGYCELRKVNTASRKGYWWVRYSSANQASFDVCGLGVRLDDLDEAKDKNKQNYVSSTTTIMTTAPYFATVLARAQQEKNLFVSACYTNSNGKKERQACVNNIAKASIDRPADAEIQNNHCYAFKGKSAWNMYIADEEGDLIHCNKIEKLKITHFYGEPEE